MTGHFVLDLLAIFALLLFYNWMFSDDRRY